jgi:hypothetical protein
VVEMRGSSPKGWKGSTKTPTNPADEEEGELMDCQLAAWVLASDHPHGVPFSRLNHLIWLAEVRHAWKTGQPLTDADWYRRESGPQSDELFKAVEDGDLFDLHKRKTDVGELVRLVVAKGDQPGDLPPRERETLSWVLDRYSTWSDEELRSQVQADSFFQATRYSHDFDLSEVAEYRPSLSQDQLDERYREASFREVPSGEKAFSS